MNLMLIFRVSSDMNVAARCRSVSYVDKLTNLHLWLVGLWEDPVTRKRLLTARYQGSVYKKEDATDTDMWFHVCRNGKLVTRIYLEMDTNIVGVAAPQPADQVFSPKEQLERRINRFAETMKDML